MRDIEASLTIVRSFAARYAPDADVVLLAGSRVSGGATEHSDFDVVLLHRYLAEGAWREMVRFEEHDFEVFAHDLGTLAYFFEEIDRPSRKPVLIRMVMEGEPAVTGDNDLLAAAKDLAKRAFAAGPSAPDEMALNLQRYAISDMAESLRDQSSPARTLAAGTSLYTALASAALRGNGHWDAAGKAIPFALSALRPGLDEDFLHAFTELFRTGDAFAVQELVDAVLAPIGGRLRGGFRQTAPPTWRR